jgi:acyl carrier protein
MQQSVPQALQGSPAGADDPGSARREERGRLKRREWQDVTQDRHQEMEAIVISVLEDTVQDWDLEIEGGIGGGTTLIGELAFESIDVVQFCIALEQALGRKGLPFEKLFIRDGAYVDDITATEVATFLAAELVHG